MGTKPPMRNTTAGGEAGNSTAAKGNAVKGNNTVSILCSFFLLKILESGDMGAEWVRRAEALGWGGLTPGFFGPFRAASCLYT